MLDLLLLAYLGSALVGVSQILFKLGARRSAGQPLRRLYLNPFSLGGYALLLGVTVLSLYVYRVLPFKFTVMVLPFNTIFVGLFSTLFLGERLKREQWLGALLIMAGLALFNA